MSINNPAGNLPNMIEKLLQEFQLSAFNVYNSQEIFECLALFNHSTLDVVVINNSTETNRLVLLDQTCDLFFLGVNNNGKVSSKGILPAWKNKGNNHILFSDPIVLIVRSIEIAEGIQNRLNMKVIETK